MLSDPARSVKAALREPRWPAPNGRASSRNSAAPTSEWWGRFTETMSRGTAGAQPARPANAPRGGPSPRAAEGSAGVRLAAARGGRRGRARREPVRIASESYSHRRGAASLAGRGRARRSIRSSSREWGATADSVELTTPRRPAAAPDPRAARPPRRRGRSPAGRDRL